jgi:hypothetical protein
MDLTALYTTLQAVCDVVTGIPGALTQPEDNSIRFPQIGTGVITDGLGHTLATGTNAQARATFAVLAIVGFGRDELRSKYNPAVQPPGDTYAGPGAPLGSIVQTVSGQRYITLQFKVECHEQTISARDSDYYIERIRTRLRLPSVLDSINAAGFAIQKFAPSHSTDYFDTNNRKVDVTLLDVILNAADFATDDPITTIQTVVAPKYAGGKLPSTLIAPLT